MRICSLGFVTAIVCLCSLASGAVFDLHNLGTLSSSKSITMDGLTLSLQSSSGILNSGASTFGVDGSGSNDASALLDGGNGTAERLSFLLSPGCIVDSILISQFDGTDSGTVTIKGVPLTPVALHDGLNSLNMTAGSGSANFIDYTGPLSAGGTNGFSIDAITAHIVPEPATLWLIGLTGLVMRRRWR